MEEEEVERYKDLLIKDQHYGHHKSTPYTVLGKYARTAEEARYYAEKTIEAEIDQMIMAMDWAATVENVRNERPEKVQVSMLKGSRQVQDLLRRTRVNPEKWLAEMEGKSITHELGLENTSNSSSGGSALPASTSRATYFLSLIHI